jgi:hypothetical protein
MLTESHGSDAHVTGAHTGFSHKYNTDDVLLRSVIVGLVNAFNYQIYYENIISDTEKQTVRVPFFYAFSGDERFLQDYFSNWSDCAPSWIEGNYDPIPRGSITLTGVNIQSSNQTSRFVRGFFVREKEGELLRYNSYLNSIPISMQFNVKIMTDTAIEAFKIQQEIFRVLYKTLVFRVNFAGSVVPSQAGLPETYTTDKQFEYTYGEQNRISVSFDVEVETYFPIFDKKQEMFSGSRIEKVVPNVIVTHPLPSTNYPTDYGNFPWLTGPSGSGATSTEIVLDINSNISDEVPPNLNTIPPGNPLDKPMDSKFSGGWWE